MAKFVIVETPYTEHYIPLDKFDLDGYRRLAEEYSHRAEEIKYDEFTVRNYMRVFIWDEETGEEEDCLGLPWVSLEEEQQWLDELPLS